MQIIYVCFDFNVAKALQNCIGCSQSIYTKQDLVATIIKNCGTRLNEEIKNLGNINNRNSRGWLAQWGKRPLVTPAIQV